MPDTSVRILDAQSLPDQSLMVYFEVRQDGKTQATQGWIIDTPHSVDEIRAELAAQAAEWMRQSPDHKAQRDAYKDLIGMEIQVGASG